MDIVRRDMWLTVLDPYYSLLRKANVSLYVEPIYAPFYAFASECDDELFSLLLAI
jgi:hypothetical protein